jgi:hypothetical protein
VSGPATEQGTRARGASDPEGARGGKGGSGQKAERAAKRDDRAKAEGGDEGARAGASAAAEAADAMAAAAPDLPDDANPDTVPFTGLSLSVLLAFGLAVLAVGVTLRRGVGRPRTGQVASGAE